MHHFLTLPWHQHQTLHTLMVQHNLSQDLRTKLWSLRTRLLKLFGCLEIYNRFCWHPVDKNPRNKFDSIKKLIHIMYINVTIFFFFFWFAIWLPNGQPWAIIESYSPDVNRCVLSIIDLKVTRIRKTKWIPKPSQVPGGVLTGNTTIQI